MITKITLVLTLCTAMVSTSFARLSPPFLKSPVDQGATTVTAYVDSDLKDRRYNSYVQVRRENITLDELSRMDVKTQDGINVFDYRRDDPIEVVVIVPSDLDPADEEAFVGEIEQRLNQRFSQAVFQVKRSYMPTQIADDGTFDHETRLGLQAEADEWRVKTAQIAHQIRTSTYNPHAMDLTLGSAVGVGKGLVMGHKFIKVNGPTIYGFGQLALALTLYMTLARYSAPFNKWKTEHELPFFKDTAAVQFYNSNPLVKTMTVNELVGLTLQSTFRSISHLNDPLDENKRFSKAFVKDMVFWGLLRMPFSAAGDAGVIELLKKGYINKRESYMIYNTFGVGSMIYGLLLLTNKKQAMRKWLRFELGAKAMVWVVAKLLPARDHRLLILHPNIQGEDLEQVEYVNELKSVYLTDQSVATSRINDIRDTHKLQYAPKKRTIR